MKSISFALPLLAVLFVTACSGPADPGRTAAPSTTASMPAQSGTRVASVGSLVSGLETRLEANPDDGKGWLLLAKSYKHLGRTDDARNAYRKASALGHGDDKLASDLFGVSPALAARFVDQPGSNGDTAQ